MTDTGIQERTDIAPTNTGDHDVFAHYAEKDKITEALVLGIPLTALCGKTWIPFRDPEKYPTCPDCKKILDEMFGE